MKRHPTAVTRYSNRGIVREFALAPNDVGVAVVRAALVFFLFSPLVVVADASSPWAVALALGPSI